MGLGGIRLIMTKVDLLLMPERDVSGLYKRTQMFFQLLAVRVVAACRGTKHGDGSVRR
jgi:hypothetical protein